MAPNYQDELTAWCSKHLPGWKQTGADKGEARCELHEDKSPSLWVGLKAGRYRCMGCNREGTLAEYAHVA